jgi:exonuclease SbcC
MRPRNLKIQGFTCFRDPVEIDFASLDVFVISGPTGAGKTTIIDAICYALYGKVPRETTVSNLISRNASALTVQLEFDAGGRRFRVHRGLNVTRTTNKKTGAERVSRDISPVQFEESVDGAWTPVEDRVDKVDDAVERAVGLDYAGFTKCVLLPQGRFAEFLAGEAKQRRALLIELLDIGIYERVKVAANTRASRLNTLIDERERQLRDDFADATEEALATTEAKIAEIKPALEAAKEQRGALQEAHTHANTAAAAHRSALARTAEREGKLSEITAAEKATAGAESRMKELAAALAAAEAALKASAYDAALHTALQIARQGAERVGRCRVEAERAQAAAAKFDIPAAEKASAAAGTKRDEARVLREAAATALRAAENADRAATLRAALKAGDVCPVCGEKVRTIAKAPPKSALSAAVKAEADARAAEAKASELAAAAERDFARLQSDARNAEASAKKAADDLAAEEAALKKALPKGVAADVATIAAAFEQQDAARKQHEKLTQAFEKARDIHAAHERTMASSARTIAALRAEEKQLDSLIEQDVATRKAEAAKVKAIAAKWRWPEVNALIDASKSPESLLRSMHESAQETADRLTREMADLESQAKRIAEAIVRAAQYRAELVEMKAAHQVARDLGVLLRADNFQEFVILEAMQALALAATEHLHTLYDRFAMTVDGGEFAVIDHWEAGQKRPAKTLSGGETFVASLALALALSEQLPQLRAGAAASLESLFLDEGFGTLDPQTLDAVISALEALRSEERMVGIITHVPELAARIEHRIEVVKAPHGSTVRVAGAAA